MEALFKEKKKTTELHDNQCSEAADCKSFRINAGGSKTSCFLSFYFLLQAILTRSTFFEKPLESLPTDFDQKKEPGSPGGFQPILARAV